MQKYYAIRESLVEIENDNAFFEDTEQTVELTGMDEFLAKAVDYGMGIDLDISYDSDAIRTTKALVNFDSLTGTFAIPDRSDIFGKPHSFLFAINERGVAFINDDGTAQSIIETIQRTKRWKKPCLERFLYDFLENIIAGDLPMLDQFEYEMDRMEENIEKDVEDEEMMVRLTDIRSALQEMRMHYLQLSDLAREFEENENGFFEEENLRFFRLFIDRLDRLETIVGALRDHTMQVRDLYQSRLAEQQNRIVTLLTVVTTIAVPITFITSWYGMNFKFMPELDKPWAYPAVIAVCLTLSLICIRIFKKKKWL